ncbi:MAG: hypothetical protein IPF94_17405 [Betaproteobacteria bacterium]|nr:hypothetical protein [Betaproteobacteria bacterium]
MKNLMTAVVTALFALSTGVAFAAEPAKKDAAPAKPAASAPAKADAKADAKAEPMKKKEKKGGC